MAEARRLIRDFSRIALAEVADAVFSPEDSAALFQRDAGWLNGRLAAAHGGPTVVITHHAPSRKSIHPRFADSLLNACFVSDEYLTYFRADSIVRDLELIRADLGVERWSLLGQSFGGFTSLTYLSLAPEGLREVLITGGLAPVTGRPVDAVYAATWARTREANQRYHARYPGDRDRLRILLRQLEDEDVRLPGGDRLTARRFRQTGMWLGDSAGFERLHHLLELPLASAAFRWDAQHASAWERNPIYATLHESSYADGGATRWSAHRLAPEDALTGELLGAEHVFPWMWEDYAGLHAHREAAQLLAEHPWPRLYDADRLARNEVPVGATVYVDDMYVERAFAEDTVLRVRGLRAWITNEYAHNGLRADGERIVGRLLDMVRGRA